MTAEPNVTFGFQYSNGGEVSSPDPSTSQLPQRSNQLAISWDPVERWLRKKKEGTKKGYQLYFKHFLTYAKKKYGFNDAIGFLNWANSQPQWVAVEEALEDYTEKLKASVKPVAASALITFLEKNGYTNIPKMGIEAYHSPYIPGYTRSQILSLLGYLDDPQQKLYVLFEKDDGFRARTNLALKWHHLKPDFDAGQKFIHPYLEDRFYKGRKAAGLSFIGPDCTWLLKDLIRQGEIKVNPEKCDTRSPDESKWKCNCEPIFPFAYTTIYQVLVRANHKAGLPEDIQPTHGLRKFFENALDKCEPPLDTDKKRQLEGHSIGIKGKYADQVESLRPLYERAYPHLSFSEDAIADQKMKALIEEVRALRARNQVLEDIESRLEKNELAVKMLYERERR